MARGQAELDEGHEALVGARPLLVRMDAEPAVLPLAREKRANPRVRRNAGEFLPHFTGAPAPTEQVREREEPDGGVLPLEEPSDRRVVRIQPHSRGRESVAGR